MRRSDLTSRRRSGGSDLDGRRISLVLTQDNFLDTLFVHKVSGAPVYATVTTSRITVLYTVDTTMTLQKVATIDCNRGKTGRSIIIGETTTPIDQVFPTRKLFNELVSLKPPSRKYTCGSFACTWVENGDTSWIGLDQAICYRSTSCRDKSAVLAELEFCAVAPKPKVQIHIYPQDDSPALGPNGMTELDHTVLSAILLHGGSFAQRKPRLAIDGWMDEVTLQDMLWSSYGTSPPPLYTAIVDAGNQSLLPAYDSRMSLVDRRRSS